MICHREERRSLLISANQPFTAWDEIFPSNSIGREGTHCAAGKLAKEIQ